MIPNSLNTQLLNISQQLENGKQVFVKLQEAERVRVIEENKLESAKQKMGDEFQEVKDLENITLKSIWYDLLNKKFSELEREQAEYYQAKMQFEILQNKFDNLSFEIKTYKAQVLDYQTIKAQYEGLIQEKMRFLKENNHASVKEIFDKQEVLVKSDADIKEIQEALSATENVLNNLPEVMKDLKDAKNYATWDMVGGGTMATYMKRQKMNDAKLGIIKINYVLDKLRRELKDLKPNLIPTEIKFDTSWEFADYFFDNLIIDMQISNRIAEAYSSTVSLFNAIMLLKEKLILEKNRQQNLYQEQEKSFRALVESL